MEGFSFDDEQRVMLYNEAPFTLLRFHLDPFLLLKTELCFLPVHNNPF